MFKPTHSLSIPGEASRLVEAVVQDGTAPWFKLYTASCGDDAAFEWFANGSVEVAYTGERLTGASVNRI